MHQMWSSSDRSTDPDVLLHYSRVNLDVFMTMQASRLGYICDFDMRDFIRFTCSRNILAVFRSASKYAC